jgi:hypothetical protein
LFGPFLGFGWEDSVVKIFASKTDLERTIYSFFQSIIVQYVSELMHSGTLQSVGLKRVAGTADFKMNMIAG